MEYLFETAPLAVRKFQPEDTAAVYETHLEEDVKKWIPNESYGDPEDDPYGNGMLVYRTER